MTARLARVLQLWAVLALVLLPACADRGNGPPATEGPPGDPPVAEGGPPPAWLSVGDRKVWLAYSSYCWAGKCADFVHPVERDDVPLVRATVGEKAVFHLGFDPVTVDLVIAAGAEALPIEPNGREPTWTVDRTALLVLNVTGPDRGQASYVVDIRFPQPGQSP